MRLFLVPILLLLLIAHAGAQTYTGKVVDASDRELHGVSVILLSDRQSPIAFGKTGRNGDFAVTAAKQPFYILFSCVGFAPDTIRIEHFRQGGIVKMHEKALAIKEITIKAPRIRQSGDTLDYYVSRFRQKQDRSIADVIKKMPGLTLNTDGTIEYMGRKINKFYIEGSDLMGNKYSQASENISADKVKKVQVLENHQPIKMLKDMVFSEQAALNIVLKDDAKNVWQGVGNVGTGSTMQGPHQWLGDCSLTGMLFSRKLQSISMYKYNNTGKDIHQEIDMEKLFGFSAPLEHGILSTPLLNTPELDGERALFNNTHVLATNWLMKTKADNDFRLQLSYLDDKSSQQQHSATQYTDVGRDMTITEERETEVFRKEATAELLYKINKNDIYLTNSAQAYIDFNRGEGRSLLNNVATLYGVRPQKRYVSDDFKMNKRLKENLSYSLNAYFSYNDLPGRLSLTDGSVQKLNIKSVYWGASSYLQHQVGKVSMTYTAGTTGKHQRMDVDNMQNTHQDCYIEYDSRLTPEADYSSEDIKLKIKLPVAWLYRQYNDKRKQRVIVEPTASLAFEPDSHWRLSSSYSMNHTPRSLSDISSSIIYRDYIHLKEGTGYMDESTTHIVSGGIRYKHLTSGLFASLTGTYLNSRNQILYSSILTNGVYRSKATDRRSSMNSIRMEARLTKSIPWNRLHAGLSLSYHETHYDLLVNESITPFTLKDYLASFDVAMQPCDWFAVEEASYASIAQQGSEAQPSSDNDRLASYQHVIKAYFMPGKWQIEWAGEIYHSNDESVSFNFFSDFSVAYRTERYELALQCNNILGNETYERRMMTTQMMVHTISKLRPRELTVRASFSF